MVIILLKCLIDLIIRKNLVWQCVILMQLDNLFFVVFLQSRVLEYKRSINHCGEEISFDLSYEQSYQL